MNASAPRTISDCPEPRERTYEVRKGKDGHDAIFLRSWCVKVAAFSPGITQTDIQAIGKPLAAVRPSDDGATGTAGGRRDAWVEKARVIAEEILHPRIPRTVGASHAELRSMILAAMDWAAKQPKE